MECNNFAFPYNGILLLQGDAFYYRSIKEVIQFYSLSPLPAVLNAVNKYIVTEIHRWDGKKPVFFVLILSSSEQIYVNPFKQNPNTMPCCCQGNQAECN